MNGNDFAAPAGLTQHILRALAVDEVHARPFHLVSSPRRFFHFAFLTDAAGSKAAVQALGLWCSAHNLPQPSPEARHHRIVKDDMALRFESHAEFCTYTFGFAAENAAWFAPSAAEIIDFTSFLPQPGPLMVAIDLHLAKLDHLTRVAEHLEKTFDLTSLAACKVARGAGIVATDFRCQSDGFVRVLIGDLSLSPYRAGALAQRLMEIETYRTLALMGLPVAQSLSPAIQQMEGSLTLIARNLTKTAGLAADRTLLDELTALAAQLEADAASANFRLGASAAYDEIVGQRLEAIGQEPWEDYSSLTAFLLRRMGPAMRTCQMLQQRQARLSEKLARATNLLRTRVDVAIEEQNRDVLHAMNERTRLQLRLQQTVEGLSVAAISYYVVGLAGYVFKGLKEVGLLPVDYSLATAATVPLVVLAVAYVVHRIRHAHSDGH
eukprot:gene6961-7037_t